MLHCVHCTSHPFTWEKLITWMSSNSVQFGFSFVVEFNLYLLYTIYSTGCFNVWVKFLIALFIFMNVTIILRVSVLFDCENVFWKRNICGFWGTILNFLPAYLHTVAVLSDSEFRTRTFKQFGSVTHQWKEERLFLFYEFSVFQIWTLRETDLNDCRFLRIVFCSLEHYSTEK